MQHPSTINVTVVSPAPQQHLDDEIWRKWSILEHDLITHFRNEWQREWQRQKTFLDEDHRDLKAKFWQFVEHGALDQLQTKADRIRMEAEVKIQNRFQVLERQLKEQLVTVETTMTATVQRLMRDDHHMMLLQNEVHRANTYTVTATAVLTIWVLLLTVLLCVKLN